MKSCLQKIIIYEGLPNGEIQIELLVPLHLRIESYCDPELKSHTTLAICHMSHLIVNSK